MRITDDTPLHVRDDEGGDYFVDFGEWCEDNKAAVNRFVKADIRRELAAKGTAAGQFGRGNPKWRITVVK